jgi:hypothetical protein
MTVLNVQFTDSAQATIETYFSSPQVDGSNMGTVESNDARWLTFYALFPAMAQAVLPAPGS